MTFIQSIILGIIQGITEFVPISSSGHLVLTPFIFDWDIPAEHSWVFNVLVQLGTLVAVIIYFWRDLLIIAVAFVQGLLRKQPFANPESRMGWWLILATIPATVVGLILKDVVEAAFNNPRATAAFPAVDSRPACNSGASRQAPKQDWQT
jgi:undecaprenyl-diphosphatase